MYYTWKCRKCNAEITVKRSLADIDVPPMGVERINAGQSIGACPCYEEWQERIISKTSFSTAGNCWAKDGYTK